jgi:hypothetical protein
MHASLQKLFETIQGISAEGKVKLSAEDRNTIERETQDLITKARIKNYKFASVKDDEIEDLIEDLKNAKDIEDVHNILKHLMHEESESVNEEKEEHKDENKEPLEDSEKEDKGSDKMDKEDIKEDIKKLEKGDKGESKEDIKKDIKKDLKEKPDKEDILKSLKALDMPMDTEVPIVPPDKKPGLGLGLGKDKDLSKDKDKKPSLLDLKKKKDIETANPSMEELGMEKMTVDPTSLTRANKIHVRVTPERNVVAYHEDYGPIFMVSPKAEVRRDVKALTRLANRAYGLSVYEGFVSAAKTLGGTLLKAAGADADVDTAAEEKPEMAPATEGVSDDPETVSEEKPDEMESQVTNDADNANKIEPPKVARYEILADDKSVVDAMDTATEEKPDSDSTSALAEVDGVATENPDKPAKTVNDEEMSVVQAHLADYNKLYSARLRKANAAFIKKFSRCLKIASTRMLLNHSRNPLKLAACGVLTAENVEFDDGRAFRPMAQDIAVQLVELISAEGQDSFVDELLDGTADLMDKSDDYLNDIESDLTNLAPISIEVEDGTPHISNKSQALRHSASAGNFGLTEIQTTRSLKKTSSNDLREAIRGSDTSVNRGLSRLRK